MLIILCFCCAWAELAVIPENVPRPASTRKTPARTINRPVKTRRLKKADCEADFFFMEFVNEWMGFQCGAPFVAESPLAINTFSKFCVSP